MKLKIEIDTNASQAFIGHNDENVAAKILQAIAEKLESGYYSQYNVIRKEEYNIPAGMFIVEK